VNGLVGEWPSRACEREGESRKTTRRWREALSNKEEELCLHDVLRLLSF
jgi:hypothetical protein